MLLPTATPDVQDDHELSTKAAQSGHPPFGSWNTNSSFFRVRSLHIVYLHRCSTYSDHFESGVSFGGWSLEDEMVADHKVPRHLLYYKKKYERSGFERKGDSVSRTVAIDGIYHTVALGLSLVDISCT